MTDHPPYYLCPCGHSFEYALGAYGCPNYEGDHGPAELEGDE